jgi:coenzyme F420 hydrogenase subunit beta
MCLGLCPYLEEMGEHVAFISDCRGDQGRCYTVCPRTDTDLEALRKQCFPAGDTDFLLGTHRSVWMAKARQARVRRKAQYGGTVTALALYGLETGRTDAALLTQWAGDPEDPLLPGPLVAKNPEQVLSAAGSKYTASPTLKVLDKTLREVSNRLLVVGRPCQVLALRKRAQIDDPDFPQSHIELVVGLFCMWSLSYRDFKKMMKSVTDAGGVKRIDVPKGRFVVETGKGPVELSHEEVRAKARQACQSCYDFTAELADLSVGSTEWKDDWNTLIVRSQAGQDYLDGAVENGWIQLKPFPKDRLQMLREAAFDKKRRVLELLHQEHQQRGRAPYLRISQRERDFFLDQDRPGPEE